MGALPRQYSALPVGGGQSAIGRFVDGYRIVTNARGGYFDALVKPGDRVKEGSALGTITDVHGEIVRDILA